jgi:hypothetical protein
VITPQEFKKLWTPFFNDDPTIDELVTFDSGTLMDISIPENAKRFLIEAGLPRSAAPFLSFAYPDALELPDLATQWKLNDQYKKFREIGGTGSGNPICIEEISGRVVNIDHDNGFDIILFNSSIEQLAESMLVYRDYVKKIGDKNGDEAYIKGNIPTELSDWLFKELSRIDPLAYG